MSTTPRQRRSRRERLWGVARRPRRDKWLLLQAYVLLGVTRLAINIMPFSRLSRRFGPRMTETPAEAPVEQLREARRIAWAIRQASPYTPWRSNCFPQALTAKILLRRRGIPSTLYLGAAFKAGVPELEAHAWLRCGPLYVTGGNGHRHYGAVAAFGDEAQANPTG